MRKHIFITVCAVVALLMPTSCSTDYLDTVPGGSVGQDQIFSNTENVKFAVNGLSKLMTSQYLSSQGFNGEGTIYTWYGNYPGNDYQKSNLTGWSSITNSLYHERSTSIYDYYPWFYYYKIIGNANIIIARVDGVEGTQADKDFLKAQALTYRAYSYMMLVQLYSKRWADSNSGASRGVVLRLDESKDSLAASTLLETYEQIYADLDEAISLYTSSGVQRDAAAEFYLPDVSAAYAVYAKAALNREDWATAARYAALARSGYSLMSNSEYVDGGFNARNGEWIWGLYSDEEETLYYYQFFAYEGSNGSGSNARNYPAAISKELYDQIPETDVRRNMFLDPKTDNYNKNSGLASSALTSRARTEYGSKLYSTSRIFAYMQFKQQAAAQPGVGCICLFRASEMYLIEAEADCHLGNDAAAQQLLNELNATRDPSFESTATGDDLLAQVRLYWRIEMWGEGRDWFNYKRWNLPIVRHTASQGGSFHTAFAVTINPSEQNAWTWVFPNREFDYNSLVKSDE